MWPIRCAVRLRSGNRHAFTRALVQSPGRRPFQPAGLRIDFTFEPRSITQVTFQLEATHLKTVIAYKTVMTFHIKVTEKLGQEFGDS